LVGGLELEAEVVAGASLIGVEDKRIAAYREGEREVA
jgi:hypothetical protein